MSFFTEEQLAFISKNTVKFDLLVKMEFTSQTVYAWNGEYKITIDGNEYLPFHGVLTIDGLGQNSGTDSEQISFTVAGIPDQEPDLLGIVLSASEEVSQQLLTVYMQLFDDDWQPVGNPLAIWWGFMQPPRITKTKSEGTEGSQQSITLAAENVFYNRSRPPRGRYTDRDQQTRYPGDKFFQFVPTLLNFSTTYPDY